MLYHSFIFLVYALECCVTFIRSLLFPDIIWPFEHWGSTSLDTDHLFVGMFPQWFLYCGFGISTVFILFLSYYINLLIYSFLLRSFLWLRSWSSLPLFTGRGFISFLLGLFGLIFPTFVFALTFLTTLTLSFITSPFMLVKTIISQNINKAKSRVVHAWPR